jgi:hypothetical protein
VQQSLLDVELGEYEGCDGVGDAKHAEQNVLVGDRVLELREGMIVDMQDYASGARAARAVRRWHLKH